MLKRNHNKPVIRGGLFFLFLLLFSFFVVAGDYEHLGGDDYFYVDDVGGLFTDDADYVTRAIGDPKLNPIVADLDADGDNEIVIIDSHTVRIYETSTLSIVDAYTLPTPASTDSSYVSIQVENMDGDANQEIIVLSTESPTDQDMMVYMLEYDGATIDLELNDTIETGASTLNYGTMVCESNRCVIASTFSTNSKLQFDVFNTNGINGTTGTVSGGARWCGSVVGDGAYGDHDNDGNDDYFFTSYSASDEKVRIHRLEWNGTGLEHELLVARSAGGYDTSADQCTTSIMYVATQPLIYDIDGAPSNGKELVVGVSDYDADTYKMYSFNKNGGFVDDYPEVFLADGQPISPPFLADVFPDTAREDFCVTGYSSGENQIDVLCASEQTGLTPESEEFFWSDHTYNITRGLSGQDEDVGETRAWITHSADFSSSIEDVFGLYAENLDEVVLSYGIFSYDWQFVTNALDPVYLTPMSTQSAVIPVDVENNDRSDLIALSTTNLYYLDDGFSFSGCAVASNPCIRAGSTINPSTEAVWKINTTAEVSLIMADIDNDGVAGRVVLYHGTSNVQDSGWSANFSSGTTLVINANNESIPFIANKTGSYIMRIQVRDDREPTSVQTLDLPFVVAEQGIEYDDVVQTIGENPDDVTTGNASGLPAGALENNATNSVLSGLKEGKDMTGLSYTVLWVLIMFFFALFVVINQVQQAGMVILVGEGALLMIGVMLGVISLGVLIGFIVILVVGGAWSILPKMLGGS